MNCGSDFQVCSSYSPCRAMESERSRRMSAWFGFEKCDEPWCGFIAIGRKESTKGHREPSETRCVRINHYCEVLEGRRIHSSLSRSSPNQLVGGGHIELFLSSSLRAGMPFYAGLLSETVTTKRTLAVLFGKETKTLWNLVSLYIRAYPGLTLSRIVICPANTYPRRRFFKS